MKIYDSLTDLIGSTPLVRAKKSASLGAEILLKLELFNPTFSVKDRAAFNMIKDAESKGAVKKGSVIIEPTSGNTGIGLALVAALRGYKLILTMPETMSLERRKILSAYGAEIVLTEGAKGMNGAIAKALELKATLHKDAFIPQQFENAANTQAHAISTGPEIWADTDGMVDIFVAGVGTGGTISGVGEFLKSKNADVKIVAVEPEESAVLSGGAASPHKIQGIGAGFVPKIYNAKVVDEVIKISAPLAAQSARTLAQEDGVLAGISAGAAYAAALQLANRAENKGKKIVVIIPDTGLRYLSTGLFD